jgi:hypothetical protein
MLIPKFDNNKKEPSILTYNIMRRLIGVLGISLPVVIIIWSYAFSSCNGLLESISAYYHTGFRDLFVGILCAVSLFLFSYHGYDFMDFITLKLTGLSCLGVAFFPVFLPDDSYICFNPTPDQSEFTNIMHNISAVCFFLLLAFICIVLFTKSYPNLDKTNFSHGKKLRNKIYIFCGTVIIICVVLIPVTNIFCELIKKYNPMFWLETVALFSFGVSWLIKGKFGFSKK